MFQDKCGGIFLLLDYSEDNFVVNGYLLTLRVNKGQGAEGQTGKSFMIHMKHLGVEIGAEVLPPNI